MPSGRARCAEVDHPAGTLHSASVPDRDMSDGDAFMLSFVNSSFFFSCPQKILVWTSVPPVWKPVLILSWKVKWKKKDKVMWGSWTPHRSPTHPLCLRFSSRTLLNRSHWRKIQLSLTHSFFLNCEISFWIFANIFRNNTVRSYLAFRNRSHSRKGFGKIFILYHEKK